MSMPERSDEIDRSLSAEERADYERNETIIARGMDMFFEVGTALLDNRDRRLYRADYKTFEDYCRDRWGIARSTAYQYLDAAKAIGSLSAMADKPTSERQVRPLVGLQPEAIQEVWNASVEEANGVPTGKVVAAVRERLYPRNEPLPDQTTFLDDEDEDDEDEAPIREVQPRARKVYPRDNALRMWDWLYSGFRKACINIQNNEWVEKHSVHLNPDERAKVLANVESTIQTLTTFAEELREIDR